MINVVGSSPTPPAPLPPDLPGELPADPTQAASMKTAGPADHGAGFQPLKPKRKFSLKLILGGLMMLLLVAGIGAGLYLTRQSQDVRQQASAIYCGPSIVHGSQPKKCPSDQECVNNYCKAKTLSAPPGQIHCQQQSCPAGQTKVPTGDEWCKCVVPTPKPTKTPTPTPVEYECREDSDCKPPETCNNRGQCVMVVVKPTITTTPKPSVSPSVSPGVSRPPSGACSRTMSGANCQAGQNPGQACRPNNTDGTCRSTNQTVADGVQCSCQQPDTTPTKTTTPTPSPRIIGDDFCTQIAGTCVGKDGSSCASYTDGCQRTEKCAAPVQACPTDDDDDDEDEEEQDDDNDNDNNDDNDNDDDDDDNDNRTIASAPTPTPTQPPLPSTLPQSGPEDWLKYLQAGLAALGIGALLLLFL